MLDMFLNFTNSGLQDYKATPWSRGPLLHRGEKRSLFPLVDHGVQTPWLI